MKKELKSIKAEYTTPRKTEIKEEITEIKIDTTAMIPKEDVIVLLTKDGYIKRISMRGYMANEGQLPSFKEGDALIGYHEAETLDTLLLFTNKGNYAFVPVYEIH